MRHACLVFAVLVLWGPAAAASEGAVVALRADVHAAPDDGARVVLQLRSGFPVCLVDETSSEGVATGLAEPRPAWRAVWLPNGDRGYVHAGDVTVTRPSPSTRYVCSRPMDAASSAAPSASALPAGPAPGLPSPSWYDRPFIEEARSGRFLPLDPLRFMIALTGGTASLDPAAAAKHHIGASGGTLYLTTALAIYDLVDVSGSFGAVFPTDHATFEQAVAPLLGGDPTKATSKLQILNYSFAIGPRTPPLVLAPGAGYGAWVASLFADYGWSYIKGERFIEDCVNCRTEDLELADGTFWRVGGEVGATAWGRLDLSLTLMVSYQHRLAGAGVIDEVRVGLGIWFL